MFSKNKNTLFCLVFLATLTAASKFNFEELVDDMSNLDLETRQFLDRLDKV